MRRLYTNILGYLHGKKGFPDRLKMRNRNHCKAEDFKDCHRFFRAFQIRDLDENGNIKLETIKFPDLSCNWSMFSKPQDIWYKENSSINDGCYSFSVKTSKFNNLATPVHDPLDNNYSHTEVRIVKQGANANEKLYPPKGQKLNNKTKKLEYRTYIRNHLKIHLVAR